MPKALMTVARYIDSMSMWLGKILKFGIFVLIGILLYEIVSRYIFNSPTSWSVELGGFVFGAYFFIGGAYVLVRGAHVRMDILSSRWSPKTKAIVDLVTFPLFAVYLIVFIWGGFDSIEYALRLGQHSSSMWGPPLAPVKIIVTVGAALLLLQGLSLFIKDLSTIFKGKDLA